MEATVFVDSANGEHLRLFVPSVVVNRQLRVARNRELVGQSCWGVAIETRIFVEGVCAVVSAHTEHTVGVATNDIVPDYSAVAPRRAVGRGVERTVFVENEEGVVSGSKCVHVGHHAKLSIDLLPIACGWIVGCRQDVAVGAVEQSV